MLRLATVFSGIGAIEHALERMRIKHQIIFACDNGDVDIFSKKIPIDIIHIKSEFTSLKVLISRLKTSTHNDQKIQEEFLNEYTKSYEKFENLIKKFNDIDYDYYHKVYTFLNAAIQAKEINNNRKKAYSTFIKKLDASDDSTNTMIILFQSSVKIKHDFKKNINLIFDSNIDSSIKNFSNSEYYSNYLDKINTKLEVHDGKKIIKDLRDIADRLGMIHEKINIFNVKCELNKLNNFNERKQYIDSLYKKVDNKNKVKQSYLSNYALNEKDFHWNVSFLEGTHYKNKVDLFVGGSPCQSFSLVGKQRGLEDTRGTLFYEYARLINEIKPKVFIYENVKAVLSNDNGNTWKVMKKVFTDLNYDWTYDILNSKNYGIPQNRERLFVVGFRKDLIKKREFKMPLPIDLGGLKMKDFLTEQVSGKYYLPSKGINFVTSKKNLDKRYTQINGDIQLCQKKNQQFNWHGDFVFVPNNTTQEETIKSLEKYFLSDKVRKYVLASGTKGFYSKPKTDLDIARPLLTTMHKMHRAGIDNYVTTSGRLRKLTPRECLRLMGFCDTFKIVVSDTSMYQQAGNSIVVDVLIAIMNEIILTYPNLLEE